MKIKTFVTAIMIISILAACAPAATPLPPTATALPPPTATRTLVPTRLPTATATAAPTIAPLLESPQIAFASNEYDNWELYRMNLDGTGRTRLTFDPRDELAPAWSPDGTQLVYQIGEGDIWQIMLMNWDGSNPIQLTSEGSNQYPTWSPDGTRILFDSDRNGNRDIFVMERDGKKQTALTTDPAQEFFPAWSPDGSTIAYLSEKNATAEECTQDAVGGCSQEIFLIDPTGKFLRSVPDLKQHIGRVVWSPDSRSLAMILYVNETSDLDFYDLASQSFTPSQNFIELLNYIYPIGRGSSYFRSFSFSPQGNNAIFCLSQNIPGNPKTGQTIYSGCYLVGLDGEMVFTLLRRANPVNYQTDINSLVEFSDAVWQP